MTVLTELNTLERYLKEHDIPCEKECFVDYGSKKGFWTTDDYGHVIDENDNVIAWMPIPDYDDILGEEANNG